MNCYFQYQSKDYSHVRTSASWRKSYYINSPAKIGIYRQNETDIYLIDSGNDKEAAKKIIKIAAQQNWTIKGIVNTHSNADHIGGNAYLQQQVGCPVFANGVLSVPIFPGLKDLGKLSVSFENNMLQWKSL